MPDYEDDFDDADDLGPDEDPDPSDQDSTDEDSFDDDAADDLGDKCPHCGKYLFEDAAVCPHCLIPVDASVHNWKTRKSWITFGLFCFVLVIVATFYYLFRALAFGW